MRATELYETDLKALGIKRDGTGGKLTLRALNKLKRIRANRKKYEDQKRALRRAMYGNSDLQQTQAEIAQAKDELELQHTKAEFELDRKIADIERQIQRAELNTESKEKISAMAKKMLRRRLSE